MVGITIRRADIESAGGRALTAALAAEVARRYQDDEPPAPVEPSEVAPGRGAFLIASIDGIDVGCGAVRRMSEHGHEDAAEVKRMYVSPETRRRGVARAILAALEAEGRAIGVARLLLETGELQPEAIALYRSAGFSDTAPFGASYPLSVFLEKRLQGAT